MTKIIDADDEKTWPSSLLEALRNKSDEVGAFHVQRERIDRLAEEDLVARLNRPVNQYQKVWDEILDISKESVSGRHILGFHATRLTNAERDDIHSNGLFILTPKLVERRLDGIKRDVSDEILKKIRQRNLSNKKNRCGMTWFCHTRELLHYESGVRRFFQFWGGESLYNMHQNDELIGSVLKKIGTPTIIIASLQVDQLKSVIDVGQRLVHVWCAHRGIKTDHSPNFDGYTRVDTPAGKILRVVGLGDLEFTTLTKHTSWRTPLN